MIPQQISGKEKLNYTPYILDDHYLEEKFLHYATKTIDLSNAARSYKRTHYVYAIEQIAKKSNLLLSGIFGDEVFKVSSPTGGTVISRNLIDLIRNDFDIKNAMERYSNSGIPSAFRNHSGSTTEEFSARLEDLKKETLHFQNKMEKYYFIRFEKNLRKFFGSEVNSYNDHVHCYSPFIDYDFIKAFSGTSYMGTNYPFDSKDLSLKMRSTLLYARLVKMNYKPLAFYDSTRGFSMHDATTSLGKIKILLKKRFKARNAHPDSFNTAKTDAIFYQFLNQEKNPRPDDIFHLIPDPGNNMASDINSFIYWTRHVLAKPALSH